MPLKNAMRVKRNCRVWAAFAIFVCLLSARAARLTDWRVADSNFVFHLQCESNLSYHIQRSGNLVNWETVARSTSGGTERMFQFPAEYLLASNVFFRALQTNEPLFSAAIAARRGIDLSGHNLYVDSFDSSNPNYSTNGRFDWNKSRDRGVVASHEGITNASNGTVTIRGHLFTGPGGAAPVGPQGVIGDASWVANPANAGQIQPGHYHNDMNVDFADAQLPSGSGGWVGLPSPSPTVIDGVAYQYVLNNGDYLISGIDTLSAKSIYIQGNVRIRVDTLISMTGQDTIRLATNATLKIYANCTNAVIAGNGIVNSGLAVQFMYFGTPRNSFLAIGGNSDIVGSFHAPHADIQLNGSGGSENDFSGSLVGNSVRFQAGFRIHFDESLVRLGPMQ